MPTIPKLEEIPTNDNPEKELSEAHWSYIEQVINETIGLFPDGKLDFSIQDLIDLIGFHYKTAFIHGYKHGRADNV